MSASVCASAVGALVRGIESAGGAIKPIVVSFDGVLWIAAVAGIPSAAASTSTTGSSSVILVVV